MFEIREIALARVSRLYQYKLRDVFNAEFSLKGFEYPWLVDSREWKQGERILDVGAAYSALPAHLQKTYGCEVWVADDFGMNSDEPFWLRGRSPQEHISQNPKVKYVLERLGDPGSSTLPENYFDVVYSLSVLEHVPAEVHEKVWQHMARLLKPGGELIHAVDIYYLSNWGWRKLIAGEVLDRIFGLLPPGIRLRYAMHTPKAYVRSVFKFLGIRPGAERKLSLMNMSIDPDILSEAYTSGLNRIVKDGLKDYPYQRIAALLIHLKKL